MNSFYNWEEEVDMDIEDEAPPTKRSEEISIPITEKPIQVEIVDVSCKKRYYGLKCDCGKCYCEKCKRSHPFSSSCAVR